MPTLGRATEWVKSDPLGPAELRGHVVLVNFWTLTCLNRLREEPYVRAWSQAYRPSSNSSAPASAGSRAAQPSGPRRPAESKPPPPMLEAAPRRTPAAIACDRGTVPPAPLTLDASLPEAVTARDPAAPVGRERSLRNRLRGLSRRGTGLQPPANGGPAANDPPRSRPLDHSAAVQHPQRHRGGGGRARSEP